MEGFFMPERLQETTNLEGHAPAYDIGFDLKAYRTLLDSRPWLSSDQFQRQRSQLDQRTHHNLVTALGERFNVAVSQTTYYLEDNRLKHPHHDEPFLEVAKRGQKYRRQFGNPQDYHREQAEITGLERVQQLLATSDQEPETNILIVSPRGPEGSDYTHNFFDIYQPSTDGQITMTRFATSATYQDFWQLVISQGPNFPRPTKLTDAFFLAHPIVTEKSISEIIDKLPKAQETLNQNDFQTLLEIWAPLITTYLNALIDNPTEYSLGRLYNSLLNYSDHTRTIFKRSDPKTAYSKSPNITGVFQLENIISYYASLPVRQVKVGCGIQTGFSLQSIPTIPSFLNFRPFSTAEFANSCTDCGGSQNHFHCPGCNGQIESGRGHTVCPHCGLTKEQAGSKCA